jgi:4-amino-4-deoxy-L-arabinose transferase-like glycosyltransferase
MMRGVLDHLAQIGPTQIINTAFTVGGLIAALYLLSWQARIRPRDKQAWAAVALVLSLAVILAQLAWSNLGGAPLRDSIRGSISYLAVMLSLIALAMETRRTNMEIQRRRKLRERHTRFKERCPKKEDV